MNCSILAGGDKFRELGLKDNTGLPLGHALSLGFACKAFLYGSFWKIRGKQENSTAI